MAQHSLFWEGNSLLGTGIGDCGPYTETSLMHFLTAIFMGRTGVLSGLAVVASTPTARSVLVLSGKGVIRGHLHIVDADTPLAIADNTSGNPRIDRVVAACDWALQTIRLAVLQGTPASTPVPPALTQTEGVIWQMALAQVYVADGFTAISTANITRERTWALDVVPGMLAPTALAAAPAGWLLCNGQAVSRSTYRDLFDAIGTTFGVGDGSTTFNLPDLRGRTLVAADNMGGSSANVCTDVAADSMGGAGGTEAHTLTVAQIPAHGHNHNHLLGNSSGTSYGWRCDAPIGDWVANRNTGAYYTQNDNTLAGGGGAHPNMQPYLTVYYVIKV